MQLRHRLVSILRRVRQDVATRLDKEAINAACREENYSWKNRLLNPVNTVHLFILQVLNENTPLNDLPHKSGESFTGSALFGNRTHVHNGFRSGTQLHKSFSRERTLKEADHGALFDGSPGACCGGDR